MANSQKDKKIRQPVVAVMGHVDHGKTSFLDAIRGTRVQAKEIGGITQNTRAHEVKLPDGFKITFVDTPGHEAFSKMRERGARVTDFVLLIVAATDGVQPQTIESIEFAKKSKVPVIVAINKIDLPGANTQKIKSELASYGVNIEEYGGDTMYFEISALTKQGIPELLEGIQLLAEISELKTSTPKEGTVAEAFVLESSLDKRLGNVALCILKAGNLTERIFGVTANQIFKVRAYMDEFQKTIPSVSDNQPFWVTGLKNDIPAGEIIYFTNDEKFAKDLQNSLVEEKEEIKVLEGLDIDPESLFAQMLMKKEEVKQGVEQKELKVIIKGSTQGTLEAIKTEIEEINTEDSKVTILSSGTGDVTEDEIFRAKLAGAIIVTFQLPTPSQIEAISKREKVVVRNYEIIYELVDELSDVLDSLEKPIEEEVEVARAKVKKVFILSNGELVAGSEVIKGNLVKGYRVWIERKGEELARAKITSLRIMKDEVKEVKKGQECGILIDTKVDIQEGDEVVAYKVEKA
jgi:translation initiation factor IF-2